MKESGELDHLINQEVNIQTFKADGTHIVSPDEDLTDDGAMDDSPVPVQRTTTTTTRTERNGRSRERQVVETTTKILRRHSADAPLNRRRSLSSLGPENRNTSATQSQFRGRSMSPYHGRSTSPSRKATFVGGEYIPDSTSLFRPTQARVSSMQAVYDRRLELEKIRSPQAVKVDENYVPSDRLLRTTSARVMSQQAWYDHQKDVELQKATPVVKIDETYKPSDRLLKTTKTYQAAIHSWEKEKEDRRMADDIWWEKRKSPEPKKTYKINVPSKLTEPTKSYLASKRGKAPNAKGNDENNSAESPVKTETARAPVVLSDHLLKPTTATIHGSWKVAHDKELHPEEPPKPVLHLATKNSHAHVKSKLYEETSAAKYKKKIFSSELEQAQANASPRSSSPNRAPVKDISAHLLENPKARPKSPPVRKDPREKQWNSVSGLSASKSTIPALPESATAVNHTAAAAAANNGSNSSRNNSPARRESLETRVLSTPKKTPTRTTTTTTNATSNTNTGHSASKTSTTAADHSRFNFPNTTSTTTPTRTNNNNNNTGTGGTGVSSARKSTGSKIPVPSSAAKSSVSASASASAQKEKAVEAVTTTTVSNSNTDTANGNNTDTAAAGVEEKVSAAEPLVLTDSLAAMALDTPLTETTDTADVTTSSGSESATLSFFEKVVEMITGKDESETTADNDKGDERKEETKQETTTTATTADDNIVPPEPAAVEVAVAVALESTNSSVSETTAESRSPVQKETVITNNNSNNSNNSTADAVDDSHDTADNHNSGSKNKKKKNKSSLVKNLLPANSVAKAAVEAAQTAAAAAEESA